MLVQVCHRETVVLRHPDLTASGKKAANVGADSGFVTGHLDALNVSGLGREQPVEKETQQDAVTNGANKHLALVSLRSRGNVAGPQLRLLDLERDAGLLATEDFA